MTPREYFGRLVASDLRRADLAGKTLRALSGPDDSFPLIVEPPPSKRRALSGGILASDDRQPLPQGDRPMLTPHEAAVEHLKLLDRAEHPEIEEVLAVARMYPVAIQQACAAEMKRSGQVAAIDPIKAVADRQAVEIQELLDALTSPATDASTWRNRPSSFDLMHEVRGPATEPAVIASEPFKIAEPEAVPADRALDDLAHQGSATVSPDPTLVVHADSGESDGATSRPAALDENHSAL